MGKSTKDASKPKSKLSAYQFFMVAMKDERKAKNPGESMKLAELSKDVSEKWKNISDKDKKKYEEMAAKDTKRFKEEMTTYVPTEVSKKRKRGQKDPNAPKRALSSFFFFCNEERPKVKAETPGLTVGEVAKEMGKRWEVCKIKAKYEEMNRKDKERYEKEKESYVPVETSPPTSKKTTKSKAAPKGRKKAKVEKEEEDEDEDERENEGEEEEEDSD